MQVVAQEVMAMPERASIAEGDRWNVEALFASWDAWEEEFARWAGGEAQTPRWQDVAAWKKGGDLSATSLKGLLDLFFKIDRNLLRLFTYAHLRHDEDIAEEVAKKAYLRVVSACYAFRQETSWIEPAILQFNDNQLLELLSSPLLGEYQVYLEKIARLKQHTLSAQEEELLASSGNALETASQAFSALNNADLQFPPIEDSQGVKRELTHGKYRLYLKSDDRKLRAEAFKQLHRSFFAFENTICALLNGQLQRHLFEMQARRYSSCLEASLFPHQIDVSVYTSLIAAVREHLPALHRYIALRKQALGVDTLHPYDLHVPLVKASNITFSFKEAVDLVVASVSVLGQEYQKTLYHGLTQERWVDRYENKRKRSGAYSSGCYDSMPYILMNYYGTLNDVMTLTHEAGHSMHSLLSRRHQPYQYAQYSLFVAEVASTFHEELLLHHLLSSVESREKKAFLINQKLDDLWSTLIRQTMFAEFELKMHEWVQKGVPLTPLLLRQEYRRLNEDYFGSDLYLDEEIDIEWARIPHFYYNFYVYQYATGICAAHALAEQVLSGDVSARNKYLAFLSSGCSRYPIDLLKETGVDMQKLVPVEAAMRYFDSLVTELSQLLF